MLFRTQCEQSAVDMSQLFPLVTYSRDVRHVSREVRCWSHIVGKHSRQPKTRTPPPKTGHENLAQADVFARGKNVIATFVHTLDASDQLSQRYACGSEVTSVSELLLSSHDLTNKQKDKKAAMCCTACTVPNAVALSRMFVFLGLFLGGTQKRKRSCLMQKTTSQTKPNHKATQASKALATLEAPKPNCHHNRHHFTH